MADEKVAARKKGLHGWRAAVAVFGCGSLAAFGVFGAVLMVLSLVLNTAASGVQDSENPVAIDPTGQPREELPPGGLDLCADYIPEISAVQIRETLSSEHSDDALDSELGGGERRSVSGRCRFEVEPSFGTTSLWYFDFEFSVIVRDPDGDRDEMAVEEFQDHVEEIDELFSSIEASGEQNWADSANSFYGSSNESVSQYVVVARTRSAVYTVKFSGDPASVDSGSVPELDFERQAEELVSRLQGRFFRVIPASS
ncbi:hypothetical protein ACFXKD_23140 [Nocardiopsis aegyptia]|uniref:hypothetical protein n=1 Tax=Nocardiopsis aegyptia TaxID=220378 RepID=UPI0036734459